MTFREMAEHHGFGHIAVVAPIKPAPTMTVDARHSVQVDSERVAYGMYAGGTLWLYSDRGPRTWT